MTKTCTDYQGKLTESQQEKLIELLWDYMKPRKGYDQVLTGFGSKTKTGLIATIENIILGA